MKRTSLLLALFVLTSISSAADPTSEEQAAIKAIRAAGGQVLEIAQNDERLDIAFHLADGDITDAQLEPLTKLSKVYALNLRGTKVTDAGLQKLAGLKSLVKLHLEKTAVTDAGLQHLAGLENLEYLNLYSTAVTDAGLKHLAGCKKLKRLYLWQTKVTDAGAKSLKTSHPDLDVNMGLKVEAKADEKKPEEKK